MYLVEHLLDVGPILSSPMGAMAVRWGDLVAWEEKTSVYTRPWEARLLVRLSRSYLAEFQEAEDVSRPMPWLEMRHIIERRDDIAKKVKSVFGGWVQPGKAKRRKRRRTAPKPERPSGQQT